MSECVLWVDIQLFHCYFSTVLKRFVGAQAEKLSFIQKQDKKQRTGENKSQGGSAAGLPAHVKPQQSWCS